jgi:pyrroloquinoline quinone biosynthesis protein B
MRSVVAAVALLTLACTGGTRSARSADLRPTAAGPEILVLGTVQDGGFPHAGCPCARCQSARADPKLRRRIASLALRSAGGQVFLIDVTPDIREQLDALRVLAPRSADFDRSPVDGVLLTHAHIGHYTGLAFFGRESISTRDLRVYCTPRMADYLSTNGPWSQLVRLRNIALERVEPGGTVELADDLSVQFVRVPHRDEYTDTVGFRIAGPRATVLYVPDTDGWGRWNPGLLDALDGVDWALLDATFYSMDELPGRDPSEVPHPPVTSTMELLGPLVRAGRLRVAFTHLNHTNPALDPTGPERAAIEAAGFGVLEDGQRLPL